MEDFKTWYKQFPLVTRTYITIASVLALLQRFNIFSPSNILFDAKSIYSKFQIWRLFTDYFYLGPLNFGFLFNLLVIFFAFSKAEALHEGPGYADFFYLILYVMTVGDILAWMFDYLFLSRCLIFALIYIWCKRRPFETVRFYFGIQVKSAYFPWVLLGFHFIMGDDITQDLFGLAAGHSYVVLKDFLPVTHNKRFLETPKFLYVVPFTAFGARRNFQNPQQQQVPAQRFFQGAGVRLG